MPLLATVHPSAEAVDPTGRTEASKNAVAPILDSHCSNHGHVSNADLDDSITSPRHSSPTRTSSNELLYLIQPVYKLPSIDPTRTVAGVMFGRRNARHIDAWVVRAAIEYSVHLHALCFVFLCVSPFVVFTKTLVTKVLVTAVVTLTLVPVLVVHGATLCWDMLRLLTTTFEFWFLLLVNIVDNMVWVSLFRGVRVLAMLVVCAGCMLGMFLDANIHTRALVLRLFLAGAPTLLFALAAVSFRLAADLVFTTVDCWGVTIDPVDIVASGTWIVAFFMVKRAFRNRRVIFSRTRTRPNCDTDDTILCEMFHPTCRLVPYDEAVRRRRGLVGRDALGLGPLANVLAKTQLELSDSDLLQVIDAGNTFLVSHLALLHSMTRLKSVLVRLLNVAGMIGCVSLLGLSVWQFVFPNKPFPMTLILPTCLATGLFVLVHFAHLQRALFRSILFEIDAWFVSIQATFVSLGACDVLLWDQRSLLVGVAWVWLHWMIGLDALTPVVRERLRLSRLFILLVNGTLMLCPLWLAYMLYFSEQKARLRNRVVFHVTIAHIEVRAEMLSFLASRIFTLWIWMCRFFWRELMRPADAFKLIKHRVKFRVVTGS